MAIKEKPKKLNPEKFIASAKAETQLDTKDEPTKKLIIEIPLSLHNKIKIKAARENTTIKQIVGELLKEIF